MSQHPTFGRPIQGHGPRYAHVYLDMTNGQENMMELLESTKTEIMKAWSEIPSDKENHRYAEGKWSIKGVLSHVIDTERVFQYRAFRIARHDDTPIEGFEQDHYDTHANLDNRSLAGMIKEFELVRNATIQLFSEMTTNQLDFVGTASNNPLSARTAGWIILGHALHHQKVLEERYL